MDQLSAVVRIHAGSGYSGPLCAARSTEHVRFFVSTDDGATWTDAGTDSFAVHDTTGPRPLDHAVNVVAPMRRTLCWIENHPLVRAILSWNVAPPAGNPNWSPPWGNVVDVRVRPRSRRFPKLVDLIEVGAIKIPKNLAATLVLDSPITITQAPSPAVAELAKTYADAKVPAHRFALPAYLAATQSGLQAPAVTTASDAKATDGKTVSGAFGSVLSEINLSGKDFLVGLFKTDGDTSYEELGCIGYDPVDVPDEGGTSPSTTRSAPTPTAGRAPTGRSSPGCAPSCPGSRLRHPGTPTGAPCGATARRPRSSCRPGP